MISRILGQTVCVAVLATCAGAQTIPLVEQIAGRLAANALKADVSFLASDVLQGRANTSPELRITGSLFLFLGRTRSKMSHSRLMVLSKKNLMPDRWIVRVLWTAPPGLDKIC